MREKSRRNAFWLRRKPKNLKRRKGVKIQKKVRHWIRKKILILSSMKSNCLISPVQMPGRLLGRTAI
jgi:hypothetical protein